jgi:hypothetical protein
MSIQEHAVQALKGNLEVLKRTLADFTDADMLARPVENANHTAWQVGHIICSETRLVKAVGGNMPDLPDGFEAKFTKETAKSNDPAEFPRKAELLSIYDRQRQGAIAWTASLKDTDLDQATPERLRQRIPTVAAVMLLLPSHLSMHLGQIQVIRRKLNKPVLF